MEDLSDTTSESGKHGQLLTLMRDADWTDKLLRLRTGEFWISVCLVISLGVGIAVDFAPWSLWLIAAEAATYFGIGFLNFGKVMKEGPPAANVRTGLRKLIAANKMESTLGSDAVRILDEVALNARRIYIVLAVQRMQTNPFSLPSEAQKKIGATTHSEVNRLFKHLWKSIVFKQPPKERDVDGMRVISQELSKLANLLESEESMKTIVESPSALREILEESEARIAARTELDQST